jgi:thiol-disulfide isomerase/thioredoxin
LAVIHNRLNFCLLFLSAVVAASGPCWPSYAQPRDAAAAQPQPSGQSPALQKYLESLTQVKAFSYHVASRQIGGEGAAFEADLSAVRADAGGWKVYIKGTALGDQPVPIEIGYDGVSARSLKSSEKTVVERTIDTTEDLIVFFSGHNAKHPVAWEMLAEKPFDGATSIDEGQTVLGGEPATIILIKPVSAPADGPVRDDGTRLFVSTKTNLPIKIERLQSMAGKENGERVSLVRVLELSQVKINDQVSPPAFSLTTPDGFRVRADAPRVPRAPRKAATAAPRREESTLLAVGSDAPDWTLKNADGADVSLQSLRGTVVVLDFWATWCGPCKAAMPSVQKLHVKYEHEGVKIFGVNTWERGDPEKYMKDNKLTYGLLLKGDKVAADYKVTGIPTFYVIGKDGKIVLSELGKPNQKTIEDAIESALK